jgi:hypothetical protein
MPRQSAVPLTQSQISPLMQEGKDIQWGQQLLTDGMASYPADYLRAQTVAKLLSNLMQSRRQGVWTSRDNGITKYLSTQFNSGAVMNSFGQFIDTQGIQQLILQVGSHLTWLNLATTIATNLSTSLPTDHSNNSDPLYPLFCCIREFQTIVAGTTLYSVMTHPQNLAASTINASGTLATFQLNPANTAVAGTWGYIGAPMVGTGIGIPYGFPALCEPFLNSMAYAGFPISFQTNPPSLGTVSLTAQPLSVYDILITNYGLYNTVTQSSTLLATDGVRLQVPAICGRPTALKTIQLNNQSNSQALLVGCEKAVCLIQGTGANDFGLIILTTEFGIPSNRALLQIQNDIVFLANDGIRTFSSLVINANLLTSAISYCLQDYVQQWDQTWLNQAFAVRHRVTKDIQFWMPELNEDGSSTGQFSVSNQGAVFNGTNAYLKHADNASLETGNISFTWAGWLNLASVSGSPMMATKWDGSKTGDYALYYSNINNAMEFLVMDGVHVSNGVLASNFGPFSTNTWYFVVAWFDAGTGLCNISVNNGAVNSFNPGYTPASSTQEFDMGATTGSSPADFLDGVLQCIGFWKRTLTTAEITQLYNSGTPLLYAQLPAAMQSESATTFISYWNLNETSGTRNDSRSTGNNLTDANSNVGTSTGVTAYVPALVNLAFVFNYGDSSPNVQAIPQLKFAPSIRQQLTQAAAIEVQDPHNNFAWTMLGGGYNGYLYTHYSGNLNDGMSLPWTATFPLFNTGNDMVGMTSNKINIICEGIGQNIYANAIFLEMMANGTIVPQNAQQGPFNLISGANLETILGQWILGQSAFPGTFVQLLEYTPTGEARFFELQLQGYSGNNVIDLIGADFDCSTGSTRR